MSSTRYLIGGLAVIGGVYYYDQNVRQIIPRSTVKHEAERFDKFASQNAAKLGDKVTHVVEDAKSELSHQKAQIKQQWRDAPDAKAAEEAVKDYSKDVRRAADDQLGHKNPVIKGVDKYIDLVNKTAGETTTQYSSMGRDVEVKGTWWDRWFHSNPDTVEDKLKSLDAKGRAEADRLASWGLRKSDEVAKDAEKKKDGLFSWGSKKADEAQAKADQVAKEAEKNKDGLLNWGSKKADEAAKEAEKKKDGLLNWGSKKADEAQAKVDEAAKEAEKKKDGLLNWGSKKADEAAKEAEKTKDGLLNWGSKKADEAQAKADEVAKEAEKKKDGLLNWGSKKADEAQAKADEAAKEAEKTKAGLLNWGSKKADEAQAKADELAKEAEKQKKSWFSWGSKKADEAADVTGKAVADTQKAMEQAKGDALKKKDEVVSWGAQKLGELQNNLEGAKDHLAAKFEEEKAKATEVYNTARAHVDDLLARYETSKEVTKDRELQKAKEDLKSALGHLKLYGESTASSIKQDFAGAGK